MQLKTGNVARQLIILLLCSITLNISAQVIRINEFMAVNNTTLVDRDGDYSDWIEIYNPTSSVVYLEGWGITIDAELPFKWLLPDVFIDAGSYLVIFASGKDRKDSGSELHTNFKLSGSGEYLALFNASGTSVSEFTPGFPVQKADYSYGYYNNGYSEFSEPTPGATNENSAGIVIAPPAFSVKHGMFQAPFNLEMQAANLECEIYYTLDGSNPTPGNSVK